MRRSFLTVTQKWVLAIYLGVTVLLWPFRSISVQDDSVFTESAIRITQGDWDHHPLMLAAAVPQLLLGSGVLWGMDLRAPFAMSVLNGLSWCCFGLLLFLVFHWAERVRSALPTLAIGAFFAFPLFTEYFSSFLSEGYSCLFLALATGAFLFNHRIGLVLAVLALGLQRQTLLAFPFFWAMTSLLRREKTQESLWTLFAVGLSAATLSWTPRNWFHSPVEAEVLGFWWTYWSKGGFGGWLQVFERFLQLLLALGLFLIPITLSGGKKWSRRILFFTLAFQALYSGIESFWGTDALTAGVLSTGYFSHGWKVFVLSFGVWGLLSVRSIANVVPAVMIAAFYGFTHCGDIKYSLPSSVPFLIFGALNAQARESTRAVDHSLQKKILTGYCLLLVLASVFLNRYYLDTTEVRWRLARELEESHQMEPRLISAGYGRDSFFLGRECFNRAALLRGKLSEYEYLKRIVAWDPVIFNDRWAPRFQVRPLSILGISLGVPSKVGGNRAYALVRAEEYRVLGIPAKVGVYDAGTGSAAWCFSESK